MIKPNTIVQYKDSFGIHYGITGQDKGSKIHVWELTKSAKGWVKTLMNRDIPKRDIIKQDIDKKKFGVIIGETKMNESQIRDIIRKEIKSLTEAKKWYEYDYSNARFKSNINKKWKGQADVIDDMEKFFSVYYNSTGDYETVAEIARQLEYICGEILDQDPTD